MHKDTFISALSSSTSSTRHGMRPLNFIVSKHREAIQKVWSLSATETPQQDNNSEDKWSLINSNSYMVTEKVVTGKDSPVMMFIKGPLEDRTKYEKLSSFDVTSDDSDSELYHADVISKRTSFKQMVANNIPEKIQAVYNKVDKSQLPIVKNLHNKSNKSNERKNKHQKNVEVTRAADKAEKAEVNSDDDSIGSASDLRANVDDMGVEDEFVKDNLPHPKRDDKKQDDGISESIKTCGSSAYHAECESVATNEDDASRIVNHKLRMKRRDCMNKSASTIIDNDQGSPTSADLLHQYGDKPLLLDDELEYESGELTDCKLKTDEQTDYYTVNNDDVELDVFAMAPFKLPQQFSKKSRNARPKFIPTSVTIPEDSNLLNFESKNLPMTATTSTPLKVSKPEKYNKMSVNQTDHQSNEQLSSNSFPIQSESNYGVVTVVNNSGFTLTHSSGIDKLPIKSNNKDLFGSEPFPKVVIPIEKTDESNFTVISIESNDSFIKSEPISDSLITNNQNDVIQPASHSTDFNFNTSAQSNSKYVNFSKQMLPINSTDFSNYNNSNNDIESSIDCDDDKSDVIATNTSPTSSLFIEVGKHSKETNKFTLKDKFKTKDGGDSSSMMDLHLKLAQKVKKINKNKKYNNDSSKSDFSKIGFSNMSFEDFPSDDNEEDNAKSIEGKYTRIVPFEVVRNEKIGVVEKKFGSLKRRSNPFS